MKWRCLSSTISGAFRTVEPLELFAVVDPSDDLEALVFDTPEVVLLCKRFSGARG